MVILYMAERTEDNLLRENIDMLTIFQLFWFCLYFLITESCFVNCHSLVLDPKVISVIASNTAEKHLYGLDRGMNFMRSTDSGSSWESISNEYFRRVKRRHPFTMYSGIPDNITSTSPPSSLYAVSSKGTKWGGTQNNTNFSNLDPRALSLCFWMGPWVRGWIVYFLYRALCTR